MTDRMKASVTCLFLAWVITGCGKYQSHLTEREYQRFLAKREPIPESTLQVSSEQLTVDEVVTMQVKSGYTSMSLANMLSPTAQNNDPNTFKELAFPPIEVNVGTRINNILLYQKAKKESHDKIDEMLDDAADRKWREFVLITHDSDEASAEKSLHDRGITRTEFKDASKRELLSNFHVESRVPSDRPISHKEYLDYYNRLKLEKYVKKPLIEFSLIDIQSSKLSLEELTEDRQQKALALARDVHGQLQAGGEFGALATAHSHGVFARKGGRWKPTNPASLAPPYDALAPVAASLDVDQISEPVEVLGRVFIMKLHRKQTQGFMALSEVQADIRELILIERRREAHATLAQELEDIIRNASEESIDDFVDRCVDEIYVRSNK